MFTNSVLAIAQQQLVERQVRRSTANAKAGQAQIREQTGPREGKV
jgi:hypothetical protein